jgi:hypothetical protein
MIFRLLRIIMQGIVETVKTKTQGGIVPCLTPNRFHYGFLVNSVSSTVLSSQKAETVLPVYLDDTGHHVDSLKLDVLSKAAKVLGLSRHYGTEVFGVAISLLSSSALDDLTNCRTLPSSAANTPQYLLNDMSNQHSTLDYRLDIWRDSDVQYCQQLEVNTTAMNVSLLEL